MSSRRSEDSAWSLSNQEAVGEAHQGAAEDEPGGVEFEAEKKEDGGQCKQESGARRRRIREGTIADEVAQPVNCLSRKLIPAGVVQSYRRWTVEGGVRRLTAAA